MLCVLYMVFFPKVEWWVAELLFLSLNNWGLTFLQNECSQSSQIYLSPEKLRKKFTFQCCTFLNDKIDQNINFAKLSSAKYFFWCNLEFCYPSLSFGKKTLKWYSCQLEIDHVTQQPKETCQRTCSTLPIAEILSGTNARAWVSMDFTKVF
jgi:hypothetical protein